MDVEIRRLGPGDAHVLDRVAEDVFDDDIDPKRLAAYLAEPGHVLFVALKAGEVVGQVACVVHRHPDQPTELYIDNVGVAPTLHRQGIAKAMILKAFAWGREQGCEEAWVGTETDNSPAAALYRSLGAAQGTFAMFEYDL